MGDQHVEVQITPETPGTPSIRNPFESPSDHHHLHETFVPSPSVFKSTSCKATPSKFCWSIEDMASIQPVDIDPEEIQRQSLYLSQAKVDSDIEEKRQTAIEQFFTKDAIVPSPWAAPDTRKNLQSYAKNCMSTMVEEEPEKTTVACQTTLSLPVTFDLEKVLGDCYRYEEACEAVQESLSSSSLRRKLFLDGMGSSSCSDCSTPSSPERGVVRQERPSPIRQDGAAGGFDAMSSVASSPMACGGSVSTPSTGQFSSSPIKHGCFRDCSLGSISSPLFLGRLSPAGFASPSVSPIVGPTACTPVSSAERKRPTALTPCAPYVEGCSPIHSCYPHTVHGHNELQHSGRFRPRPGSCHASPPLISSALSPKFQNNQEAEEPLGCSTSSSSLPPMELDPSSPLAPTTRPQAVSVDPMEPLTMEEDKDMGIEENLKEEEEEEGGRPSGLLTSSRMGYVSAMESSHMFVSLLAEGSSIRYDSSMQVDSGYNTTSAGTGSLIDGLGSECHGKESFVHTQQKMPFEALNVPV